MTPDCSESLVGRPDEKLHAARCCRPALDKQLEGLTHLPKFLMGTASVAAFTKVVKGGLSFMRGFVRDEIKAIASFEPFYAYFRNPYSWAVFDGDLRRFSRLIAGTLEEGPRRLDTSPTAESLRKLVEGSDGFVAVDIETAPIGQDKPWTGKSPTQAALRSIGFGTETEALSFMWSDADSALQLESASVLRDPNITKVFHNGPFFDITVLERYGMTVVNWEDTRDLRAALSATSELSLRYVTSNYCDYIAWKEQEGDTEDTK